MGENLQHVFTLIALLGIAAALFLGYKLVKRSWITERARKPLKMSTR